MSPQPITDAQIDSLIDQARPSLRAMIRGAFEQMRPFHVLEIGKVPFPNGQTWGVSIAVMNEPVLGLISGTILQGMPAMMKAYEKMQQPAQTAPPAPATGGFSIPGG